VRLVGAAASAQRAAAVAVAGVVLAVALASALVLGGCVPVEPLTTGPSSAISAEPASVERVVDGDTAIFRLGTGARERVRFIGIDSPETSVRLDPYGKEATVFTRGLLPAGASVLLEYDAERRDKYGRLLAYVWLAAPADVSDAEIRDKMLNAKIALAGYAQQLTLPPNVKYADRFGVYVHEARQAERGLWAGGSDSTP
jgi:endonuclease YncB( thermonuclease family)